MTEQCIKCNHESDDNKKKFGLSFCSVCFVFSPNNPEELDEYSNEKISSDSSNILDSFRKYAFERGEIQKQGMIKKASKGDLMSRPAFGYKIVNKKLIPSENFREVEEIFEEFLNSKISLTKLAKKHNFSVNGLKKILRNFTYIGKIKFNGNIHDGTHQQLISPILFNQVQNKLERLGIKKL